MQSAMGGTCSKKPYSPGTEEDCNIMVQPYAWLETCTCRRPRHVTLTASKSWCRFMSSKLTAIDWKAAMRPSSSSELLLLPLIGKPHPATHTCAYTLLFLGRLARWPRAAEYQRGREGEREWLDTSRHTPGNSAGLQQARSSRFRGQIAPNSTGSAIRVMRWERQVEKG